MAAQPLWLALHLAALMAWFGAIALRWAPGMATVFPAPASVGNRPGSAAWAMPWPAAHVEITYVAVSLALALASAIAWLILQAANLFDTDFTRVGAAQLWTVMLHTAAGRVWTLRMALLGTGLALVAHPLTRRGWASALVAMACLASLAASSHAASGPGANPSDLGVAAMVLHVVAAGAWVGALPVLLWVAWQGVAPATAALLEAFARLGKALVVIVLVTGGLLAWQRTGSAEALLQSIFGQTLMLKVGFVALMGVAAVNNSYRLLPRLRTDSGRTRLELARSIGAEIVLGLLAVVAAAILVCLDPPR